MTHSTFQEENEDVIKDTIDKFGNEEWILECVLPSFASECLSDSDLTDCLRISPSKDGNGVFIACLKRIKQEEEEVEDDAAVRQSVTFKSDSQRTLVDETGKKKKKKKSKKNAGDDAKNGRNLIKVQRQLVKRLSQPRKSEEQLDTIDAKSRQKSRSKSTLLEKGKSVDSVATESEETESQLVQIKVASEFTIFGVGLKNFFAPREMAVNEIKQTQWRYPVPNPTPWK